MPELPEVQTVVNDLNRKIIGEKIVAFWSEFKKNVRPSFSKFEKGIVGAKIIKIRRIGKHIIIDLDNDFSIIAHLKMTGHFLYKQPDTKNKLFDEKVNQYVRHKFTFENGAVLDFSDLRKFAWLNLVETDKVEGEKELKKLGIDAVDKKFTLDVFKDLLNKKKNSLVGTFLLNQEVIAGIGNIYRSEILFEAGVKPNRKVSSLNEKEIEKIFTAIGNVLNKALKLRGTSESDYRDTDGKEGGFQNVIKVYGKGGEKCHYCDSLIKREKQGQRSVFYCEKCQK